MDRGAWRATVHGVRESDMTEQFNMHGRVLNIVVLFNMHVLHFIMFCILNILIHTYIYTYIYTHTHTYIHIYTYSGEGNGNPLQ